ncbi:MAG: family 16 glycosylhydrolase [Thiobacillus sp.]
MNKVVKRALLAMFAIVAIFSLVLLLQPKKAKAVSTYQTLVWSDEFNGTSLDTSKWNYTTGGGGWGNGELQTYTNNTNNVQVSNGYLTIQALRTRSRNGKYNYTSGRINTKDKAKWQYGRIEVRAKLPQGIGSWPAIWMLPNGAKYGSTYLANGEIDQMEEVGADQNEVNASAHSLKYNPANNNVRTKNIVVANAQTTFHNYGLEWTPNYLSFTVDGVEFYRVNNDHTGYQSWPYDQPYYLLLNLAIGGSWGGYKGVDNSSLPWKFAIDYVRVYQ